MQQILAYETDLLEFGDLFDGNPAVDGKVEELKAGARAELARIDEMGGAVAAIDYMKSRLVESNAARLARIEAGETIVVGVNKYDTSEESPLSAGEDGILVVDPAVEADQVARLQAWRGGRASAAIEAALAALRDAAQTGQNIMPASIAAAKAGVTTGEWGRVMRDVFGEYRAPTGLGGATGAQGAPDEIAEVRSSVEAVSGRLGRRLKIVVGKPGLDGHSNGAEQIAMRARDCGMEVVYEGIRLTPEQIVTAALEEGAHVVGLSILSGSHLPLIEDVMTRMRATGLEDVPVVAGGIIPDQDADALRALGVARFYMPKDFELNRIMADIVDLVDAGVREAA
jgi:(2R)-ethylmalonyl-CoA mutase